MPSDFSAIDPTAPYLRPYAAAARRTQGRFETLLWAGPHTQALRFDALCQMIDLNNARVTDVGCGRADLLEYLAQRRIKPAHYTGIEAIPELAEVARERAASAPSAQIIQADFVTHAPQLFSGAEVILVSGSLNTLSPAGFYSVLTEAFSAVSRSVVFNFLCSPSLAAADYLHWHQTQELLKFAYTLTPIVHKLEGYLEGDCTLMLGKM